MRALKEGKEIGMKSYAIVGYNGGESKKVADHSIHFNVNDMQIAEDTQLIVGHLCMQWLNKNKPLLNKAEYMAEVDLWVRSIRAQQGLLGTGER